MRALVFLLVAAATVAAVWAQAPAPSASNTQPYTPVAPSPSVNAYGGGYWGGSGGGASTVAGSSLNGMASVISAKGDYNLSTSAAAVNMTQAQKQEIENRGAATNTYFQMRQTNKQARAAEEGPRATVEQIARIAKDGLPKPLSPGEINQVTGQINWPSALQMEGFAAQRSEVDGLSANHAKYGTLGYADQMKLRELINGMAKQLKSRINDLPPQDYTVCRDFLRRLLYAETGSSFG
jgi:hypothetical protein